MYSRVQLGEPESPTATQPKPNDQFDVQTPLKTSFWRQWSALFITVLGFVVACGLGIGHHFFYSSLNRTAAGEVDRQQWALRIGTFFAVAFGTIVRLTIGTAYLQYVWRKLKHTSIELGGINNAFDVLSNIFSFASLKFWQKLPLAALVGAAFWSSHIVTLFPPATLSTVEARLPGLTKVPVPSVMYIDRSVAFGDEPRFGPMSSLSVPGVASPTRPDASKISTYVGRNNISSGALETLYEDARRTKDAIAPVALEDPLDYEYSSLMQLPWISCEAVESSTVTPFLSQIADALDIVLTRKVLDQPQNHSQLMEVLNVTVDENFRFTYQQRFSSSTDEIINTSRPLAGRLDYLAWAGAVDLKGSARNISDMFLHSWPLNSSVGDLNAMLDGSLTILWRPDENSNVNVTKCQMHNATVEVNVQVSRGDPTLYYSHMVELGPALSDDKALWTANDEDLSWASLALNAWMNPLYRHIQGTSFYTRQAGPYGTYERDLVRIDDIETLAHDYALSLMSGAEQGLWYPSYVQSNFSGNRIIYHYEPVNLITAYASMLVATAVVVVLGMLSFIRNGSVSYDNKFTTIAASMQNPEMADVLRFLPVGSAKYSPLAEKVIVRLELDDASDGVTVQGHKFIRG